MKKCRACGSPSVELVTDYEHINFESDNNEYIRSKGWLCTKCECFHDETGYEFFSGATYYGNVTKPTTIKV